MSNNLLHSVSPSDNGDNNNIIIIIAFPLATVNRNYYGINKYVKGAIRIILNT